MITITYAALTGLLALVYFVIWPVLEYFRDPKGFSLYSIQDMILTKYQASGDTPTCPSCPASLQSPLC